MWSRKNWRELLGVLPCRLDRCRGTGVPRGDNPSLLAPKHTGNYTENGWTPPQGSTTWFCGQCREHFLMPFCKPGVRVAILGFPPGLQESLSTSFHPSPYPLPLLSTPYAPPFIPARPLLRAFSVKLRQWYNDTLDRKRFCLNAFNTIA